MLKSSFKFFYFQKETFAVIFSYRAGFFLREEAEFELFQRTFCYLNELLELGWN
jgi:hypothetical protein